MMHVDMNKIRKKNGNIYKIYLKKNLLDRDTDITVRIKTINNFDHKHYHSLVETKILEEEDRYIYCQKKIDILTRGNICFDRQSFVPLIETLEYLESIDFVHGDLNQKNIKYTSEGFRIIDFEPSLVQLKDGRTQFMATVPYISTTDLNSEKITKRTDKIGVYFFLLKMAGEFSIAEHIQLLAEFRKGHVVEQYHQEIENLSYPELLTKVFG
jgi:serine/threonine protein kinase